MSWGVLLQLKITPDCFFGCLLAAFWLTLVSLSGTHRRKGAERCPRNLKDVQLLPILTPFWFIWITGSTNSHQTSHHHPSCYAFRPDPPLAVLWVPEPLFYYKYKALFHIWECMCIYIYIYMLWAARPYRNSKCKKDRARN